ncbi:hypothetical protein ACFL22_00415 [Patescibacteria group bacterium]
MKEYHEENVHNAAYQFGLCISYLPSSIKKGWVSKELLQKLKDVTGKLRPIMCKELNLPEKTGWVKIFKASGNLNYMPKAEKQENYNRSSELILTGDEAQLVRKLDNIRHQITQRL